MNRSCFRHHSCGLSQDRHLSGLCPLRDWSLITGRGGGATKREGGAREVLPLQKGGAEKVLAILKGGHKKFWGCSYTGA